MSTSGMNNSQQPPQRPSQSSRPTSLVMPPNPASNLNFLAIPTLPQGVQQSNDPNRRSISALPRNSRNSTINQSLSSSPDTRSNSMSSSSKGESQQRKQTVSGSNESPQTVKNNMNI
jgi:hypothetical protein